MSKDFCFNPFCPQNPFYQPNCKACGNCKMVWYCSKECQKAHWKIHKNECEESRNMRKSKSKDIQLFQKKSVEWQYSNIPSLGAMAMKYLAIKNDDIVREVYVMDQIFENDTFQITDLRFMSLEQAIEEERERWKDFPRYLLQPLLEAVKIVEAEYQAQPELVIILYVIYYKGFYERAIKPVFFEKIYQNEIDLSIYYDNDYYIDKINNGKGSEYYFRHQHVNTRNYLN